MLQKNFGRLAAIGLALSLALLGGASHARADIDIYLSQDGDPFTHVAYGAGGTLTFSGTFGDFTLVTETGITNYDGFPSIGFLETRTSQTLNKEGTAELRVLVAVTDGFQGDLAFFQEPSGTDLVLMSNVGTSSPTNSSGTILFESFANATGDPLNPTPGIASPPLLVTTLTGGGAGPNFTPFTRLPEGYTLYNLTTITLFGPGDTAGSTGSTSVTAAAVPEPSTVMSVLIGLPLVGLGAWVRKRRAQS